METVVIIVMLVMVGSCSGQTIVGVSPLQRAGRGTTAVLQCTVKLRPDTRSLDLGWAAPSGETVASLVTTADLATRSEVWLEESCQRNFAVVFTIFREDAFSENCRIPRNFADTCIEEGFGYQLEAGQGRDTVEWSLVMEDVRAEDTGLYRCQVSAGAET